MPVEFNKNLIGSSLLAGLADIPGSASAVRELLQVIREVERQANLTVQPPLSLYDNSTGRHILTKKADPSTVINNNNTYQNALLYDKDAFGMGDGLGGSRNRGNKIILLQTNQQNVSLDETCCCDETTIIQQINGGKNVVCGVVYTGHDTPFGGYNVVWDSTLTDVDVDYDPYSMWAASPNPSRITFQESGYYSIAFHTQLDIVLIDALYYDWFAISVQVVVNANGTGVNGSWTGNGLLPGALKSYIDCTPNGVTNPSVADFEEIYEGYGEAYFSAGDYIELYMYQGNGPTGTQVSAHGDATYLIVRKIDKAG